MKLNRIFMLCTLCVAVIAADPADESFRNGVELFREGKYAEAMEQFLSAEQEAPDEPAPTYNAITAMANAERLAQMDEKLNEKFAALAAHPDIRADASYNLGTAYLSVAAAADSQDNLQQAAAELEKSIQWLKKSLLDKHEDTAAKNNLEYALKLREKLEQQKQDQQQDQQDDEKKDQQQKQDQNKDQQQNQQDQDQQKQEQNQQQQQNEQQDQQQNQQQKQPQEQKEISDATAENLLQAAKDAEKRAMKMLREQQNRKNRKKSPDGKDW